MKEWIEKNNICGIPTAFYPSKRWNRNIDLTFTNIGEAKCEILKTGTSDHWPLLILCENVRFDENRIFSYVNWNVFEPVLTLFQAFWITKQKRGMTFDEWYMNYVHFLAALRKQPHKMERKRKILTNTTPLSYSQAQRSKKSKE